MKARQQAEDEDRQEDTTAEITMEVDEQPIADSSKENYATRVTSSKAMNGNHTKGEDASPKAKSTKARPPKIKRRRGRGSESPGKESTPVDNDNDNEEEREVSTRKPAPTPSPEKKRSRRGAN